MREAVRTHQLNIKIPGKTAALTGLEITEAIGEHTKATVELVLEEKEGGRLLEELHYKSQIEISVEPEEILFKGMPEKIAMRQEKGVYRARLALVSNSWQLDVKLENRSFQDVKAQLRTVAEELVAAYGGQFYYGLKTREELGQPLVQYQETDWQFMKRLASYWNAPVMVEAKSEAPQISIGLPEGEQYEVESENYIIRKDVGEYLEKNEIKGEWHEEQCMQMHIQTTEHYCLGDKVTINGIALAVVEKRISWKGSILVFEYVLQKEEGLRPRRRYNNKIAGVTLEGKVLEVKGDRVRLHLEIDREQEAEKAYWYPMGASYTAEGSTGMYIMPQAGDTAQLHFPERRERRGYVRGISRKDGRENGKTQEPGVKYFENGYGKEMRLSTNDYTFTAKAGEVAMSMQDTEGVTAEGTGIRVKGSQINISGYNISIEGEERITQQTKGSNVVVDAEVNIWGDGGVSYGG